MSDARLRVGMVGARGHHNLAAGFGQTNLGIALVGVASDGCDDAAREWVRSAPFCRPDTPYFDDFTEMFDAVKPDVVSVGAQPARNAPAIIAALERGIHVVSDKPIADSDDELDRIRALATSHPRTRLLTEFEMRAQAIWRAAHDAVHAGQIGEPILVHAQKSYKFGAERPDYYKTRKGFPGTLIFVGSHMVDMAYWVTGLRYAAVQGLQGNVSRREYGACEDHAVALFRMANSGAAVVHADYLRPSCAPTHGDDRLRVAGSKGVVEVVGDRCTLVTEESAPTDLCVAPRDPLAGARELVRALRGESDLFTTDDSVYIAQVLLTMRRAVEEGRTIAL